MFSVKAPHLPVYCGEFANGANGKKVKSAEKVAIDLDPDQFPELSATIPWKDKYGWEMEAVAYLHLYVHQSI